jgi:stalled ribosome rescue protein Dom34
MNLQIEKRDNVWVIVQVISEGRKVALRTNGTFTGFTDVKEFKTEAGAKKALANI